MSDCWLAIKRFRFRFHVIARKGDVIVLQWNMQMWGILNLHMLQLKGLSQTKKQEVKIGLKNFAQCV